MLPLLHGSLPEVSLWPAPVMIATSPARRGILSGTFNAPRYGLLNSFPIPGAATHGVCS